VPHRTLLPLVGSSAVMRALQARTQDLTRDVSRPVLVVGARGLGKLVIAQHIHAASTLSAYPLVRLDGAHITSDALRTAFASVVPHSVLLLRHIDHLSLEAQDILNEFTTDRSRIERVIATATGDMVARVTAGTFSEALYYRLHAWPMIVPALAERERGDVRMLAETLLAQTADDDTELPVQINELCLDALSAYNWPDNLRELEATLALAQLRARHASVLTGDHLPLPASAAPAPPESLSMADLERWHLLRVLLWHNGNRTRAALSLGISRMTLISKLKGFADSSAN
jgi:DNA-binding NtrC family response regulator